MNSVEDMNHRGSILLGDVPDVPDSLKSGKSPSTLRRMRKAITGESLSKNELNDLKPLRGFLEQTYSELFNMYYGLLDSVRVLTDAIDEQVGLPRTRYQFDVPLDEFVRKSGVDVESMSFGSEVSDITDIPDASDDSYIAEPQDSIVELSPEQVFDFQYTVGDSMSSDFEEQLSSFTIPFGEHLTQLTGDYASRWDEKRILIDLVQNHLPSDSKGTRAWIQFHTTDGSGWHDLSEIEKYPDYIIDGFQIQDDGVGYPKENVFILNSSKDDESAGKFGEGLKIALAAALNLGCDVEVQSSYQPDEGNGDVPYQWRANEVLEESTLRGKKISTVKLNLLEGAEISRGSLTRIMNITPQFAHELREIGNSVLYFRDDSIPILAETPTAEILDMPDLDEIYSRGTVFVKGLLIPDFKDTIISYNFRELDIKDHDRKTLTRDEAKKAIENVLSHCKDKELIKKLLLMGSRRNDYYYPYPLEFDAEIFNDFEEYDPEVMTAWYEAFIETFGENACAIDPYVDPNEAEKAKHLSLEPIILPEAWVNALRKIHGPNGERIKTYEWELESSIDSSIMLSEDELSDDEKLVRDWILRDIVTLLPYEDGKPRIRNINIYKYPDDYFGTKAAGYASMGDTINICRESFSNVLCLLHVVFHESAHAYTGAEDPAKDFRDFLSRALAVQVANSEFSQQDIAQISSLSAIDFRKRQHSAEISNTHLEEENPLSDTSSTASEILGELPVLARILRMAGKDQQYDEERAKLERIKGAIFEVMKQNGIPVESYHAILEQLQSSEQPNNPEEHGKHDNSDEIPM